MIGEESSGIGLPASPTRTGQAPMFPARLGCLPHIVGGVGQGDPAAVFDAQQSVRGNQGTQQRLVAVGDGGGSIGVLVWKFAASPGRGHPDPERQFLPVPSPGTPGEG